MLGCLLLILVVAGWTFRQARQTMQWAISEAVLWQIDLLCDRFSLADSERAEVRLQARSFASAIQGGRRGIGDGMRFLDAIEDGPILWSFWLTGLKTRLDDDSPATLATDTLRKNLDRFGAALFAGNIPSGRMAELASKTLCWREFEETRSGFDLQETYLALDLYLDPEEVAELDQWFQREIATCQVSFRTFPGPAESLARYVEWLADRR